MCMVDNVDYDSSGFASTTTQKVRKDHQCAECYRTIRKGETYTRCSHKYDGNMRCDKQCSHCVEAVKWLVREYGGYVSGAVKEDLCEHWIEDDIHTIELGRIIVGMRHKWQRFDGTGLMALPVVHNDGLTWPERQRKRREIHTH